MVIEFDPVHTTTTTTGGRMDYVTRYAAGRTQNVGTGDFSFGIYYQDFRHNHVVNVRGRDGYVGHVRG